MSRIRSQAEMTALVCMAADFFLGETMLYRHQPWRETDTECLQTQTMAAHGSAWCRHSESKEENKRGIGHTDGCLQRRRWWPVEAERWWLWQADKQSQKSGWRTHELGPEGNTDEAQEDCLLIMLYAGEFPPQMRLPINSFRGVVIDVVIEDHQHLKSIWKSNVVLEGVFVGVSSSLEVFDPFITV